MSAYTVVTGGRYWTVGLLCRSSDDYFVRREARDWWHLDTHKVPAHVARSLERAFQGLTGGAQ